MSEFDGFPLPTGIKATLVNATTNIVENIIMVSSLDDVPPPGYVIAPMEYVEQEVNPEKKKLAQLLKEIDPTYVDLDIEKTEVPIEIGVTKWTSDLKYHKD